MKIPLGPAATPRRNFPQGEALQRDAPEHDRSGGAALQEGRRAAGKLCYMGHALMENRHGLAVGGGIQPGHRHGRAGDGVGVD